MRREDGPGDEPAVAGAEEAAFVARDLGGRDATKAPAGTAERLAFQQPNRRQDGRKEVSMSEATEVAAADP
jgi:hypothetical protein